MRRLVYFQGGGPTAVINSSFLGVLNKAREEKAQLFVSRHGLKGLIDGELLPIDLDKDYSFLQKRPGAYFGSARISLKKNPEYLSPILKTLERYQIDALLPNGGNDTMDSALRLKNALFETNIHVLAIPKTVDNDLVGTARTPGFLSAAKYIALSTSAILQDDLSYEKGRINIIETMGRDNGSLAASSLLSPFLKPDLILVPEVPFSFEEIKGKAQEIYARKARCNIVLAEGIKDEEGNLYQAVKEKDSFGNPQLGGIASLFARRFQEEGFKTRAIELSIPQRAAFFLQSKVDAHEAMLCGEKAVLESKDKSGFMIGIDSSDEDLHYHLEPLENVAGHLRSLDGKYLDRKSLTIKDSFLSDFEDLVLS